MDTSTPKVIRYDKRITFYYVRNNGYVEKTLAMLKEQGIIMRSLHIVGDWIDHLHVPEGIETLIACRLGLKTICIPSSLQQIYIDDNCLTELRLPKNSKATLIEARCNYIEHFICEDDKFPNSLKIIKLKSNRLRELLYPRHPNLWTVDIRYQNLFIRRDRIHESLLQSDANEEYEFRSCQFENNIETNRC